MTEDTESTESTEPTASADDISTEEVEAPAPNTESNDLPPVAGEIEVDGPPPDQPVYGDATVLGRVTLGEVTLREPMNHVALAEVQSNNVSALGLLALNNRLNIAGVVIRNLETAILEMRKRIEELEDEVYGEEEEPEPPPPPRPKRKRKKKSRGRRR